MIAQRTAKIVAIARDPARDPCVDLVARALRSRGVDLVQVSTAAYPSGAALELGLEGTRPRIALGGLRLDDADAIWIRHLDAEGLPEGMRADERAAARTQAEAALWSALACAPGFLLDPPEALLAVPAKPRMQGLAAALGLEAPRTLVTNDRAAVREFARGCPGGIVCKLVESGAVSVADEDGEGAGPMPTIALDEADLDDLAGLELAPMIFQERLAKRLELRVSIIGERLLVAGVETGEVVDVRTDPALIRGLRPFTGLPAAIGGRLLALCDHLGLNFASADVVLTEDGRWVFLELNSTSYFDHVERFAGLPIADAVAGLLLGEAPRRGRQALAPGR
ncbi:MAG: hypothetical protein R3B09_24230 [Nannocystaceae bacterium]